MANVKIKPPNTIMLTGNGDLYLTWQEDGNRDFAVSVLICRDIGGYSAGALYDTNARQFDKAFFFSSLEENFKEEDAPEEEDAS